MELEVKKPILEENDKVAQEIREKLAKNNVYMINLMASPGSGKTSTIIAVAKALEGSKKISVIEGDIASRVDADKLEEECIDCIQINTGGVCHLESKMILDAIEQIDLENTDILFVENVGNLVCPTHFDIGESSKIVVLSVPEGHDKPIKYPGIFQVADAVILNKYDTMPVFDFNEREFRSSLSDINPQASIFPISATKNEGIKALSAWLVSRSDAIGG